MIHFLSKFNVLLPPSISRTLKFYYNRLIGMGFIGFHFQYFFNITSHAISTLGTNPPGQISIDGIFTRGIHPYFTVWEHPSQWTVFIPTDTPMQLANSASSQDCGPHVGAWMYMICVRNEIQFTRYDMNRLKNCIAMILCNNIESSRYRSRSRRARNEVTPVIFDKDEQLEGDP